MTSKTDSGITKREKKRSPQKKYNRKETKKMWGFKGLFAYLWEVYDTTQMNCTKQLIAINCGPKENALVSLSTYPVNRICSYESVTQKIIFTSENRLSRRLIGVFQNMSLKGFDLHMFTQQFSRVWVWFIFLLIRAIMYFKLNLFP